MPDGRVIDMWAPWLPVPDMMRHLSDNYPDEMLGYLRVFYKQAPTVAAFRQRAAAIQLSVDDAVAALDAAGIARCLITGFDERASVGKTVMPTSSSRRSPSGTPTASSPSPAPTCGRACPRCASSNTGCRSGASAGSACAPS